MEDSIALWRAFARGAPDIETLFKSYQEERSPVRNKLNSAASASIAWYEDISTKMGLDVYDFAYDYVMRTGIMTPQRLAQESPLFCAEFEERTRSPKAVSL